MCMCVNNTDDATLGNLYKLNVGVVQNGQLVTNLRTAKTSYWPVFVL